MGSIQIEKTAQNFRQSSRLLLQWRRHWGSKRLVSDVWNSGEDGQVFEKDKKYSSLSLFLHKRENVPPRMKTVKDKRQAGVLNRRKNDGVEIPAISRKRDVA